MCMCVVKTCIPAIFLKIAEVVFAPYFSCFSYLLLYQIPYHAAYCHLLLFPSKSFSYSHSEVNKPEILRAGTLETICPLLESEMHPVQFKLLGTIRMLIDGQGKPSVLYLLMLLIVFFAKYYLLVRKWSWWSFIKHVGDVIYLSCVCVCYVILICKPIFKGLVTIPVGCFWVSSLQIWRWSLVLVAWCQVRVDLELVVLLLSCSAIGRSQSDWVFLYLF